MESVYYLFKHYSICVPPILIVEIQGDLSKKPKPGRRPEDEVRTLAQKILGSDSHVCSHFRRLSIASLLGSHVEMGTGQVPMDGGIPMRGRDGKIGVMFDEPLEMKLIRRWQDGEFSDPDRDVAKQYRDTLKTFDLEKLKGAINKRDGAPPLSSLAEVVAFADVLIDGGHQVNHLGDYLRTISASEELKTVVFDRWLAAKMPAFGQFAPYAKFCYRINMIFRLGVLAGLIPARRTNIIDLEYLYYLPFSMFFVSGDALHKELSGHFMREDQVFVDGVELRDDLKLLSEEWHGLSDQEKKRRGIDFGSHPPQDEKYLTCRLWKKFMRPWRPRSGNILPTLSEEQKKKIHADILDSYGPYFDQGGGG